MAGQKEQPLNVDWDNAAFNRALIRKVESMKQAKENDVKAAGVKFVSRAKSYAAVKTGFMKNNIVMEEGRDSKGYFIAVYCRAAYWRWIEFGTRFMPAQPFMRPAWAEAIAFLRQRLGKK